MTVLAAAQTTPSPPTAVAAGVPVVPLLLLLGALALGALALGALAVRRRRRQQTKPAPRPAPAPTRAAIPAANAAPAPALPSPVPPALAEMRSLLWELAAHPEQMENLWPAVQAAWTRLWRRYPGRPDRELRALVLAGPDPSGGSVPLPDALLLGMKARQFRDLARRGLYGAHDPQLQDDRELGRLRWLWDWVAPGTRETITAWQARWQEVGPYWQQVLAGEDPGAPAPPDPWGVSEIAGAQAAARLAAAAARLRGALLELAADPARLDGLLPRITAAFDRLAPYRRALPAARAEATLRAALAGHSPALGDLLMALKRQQCQELARGGRFDVGDPQFADDPRFRPFTVLWLALDPETLHRREQDILAAQRAWARSRLYWQAVLQAQDPGESPPPPDLLGIGDSARAALAARLEQELAATPPPPAEKPPTSPPPPPAEKPPAAPSPQAENTLAAPPAPAAGLDQAIATAIREYLSIQPAIPYELGGAGNQMSAADYREWAASPDNQGKEPPGIDCSGYVLQLMVRVSALLGWPDPRAALPGTQTYLDQELVANAEPVPVAAARAGDLIDEWGVHVFLVTARREDGGQVTLGITDSSDTGGVGPKLGTLVLPAGAQTLADPGVRLDLPGYRPDFFAHHPGYKVFRPGYWLRDQGAAGQERALAAVSRHESGGNYAMVHGPVRRAGSQWDGSLLNLGFLSFAWPGYAGAALLGRGLAEAAADLRQGWQSAVSVDEFVARMRAGDTGWWEQVGLTADRQVRPDLQASLSAWLQSPAMRQIQNELATRLFVQPVAGVAAALGVTSERGFAFLLDVAVQASAWVSEGWFVQQVATGLTGDDGVFRPGYPGGLEAFRLLPDAQKVEWLYDHGPKWFRQYGGRRREFLAGQDCPLDWQIPWQ